MAGAGRGVAHQGAAADAAGRGRQGPGAGAFHQGSLVPLARRMPQGRRLPDAQDAALAEEPGTGGMEIHQGHNGLDAADPEPRPGGVVVMAIGGGHGLQHLPGPLLPHSVRENGDDLQLALEGDASHLLLDQQGVVDPAPGLLPAPPAPARYGQAQDGTGGQQGRLEELPVLDPQVAPEGQQRPRAQDGHGHAVQLQGLGVIGVGGVGPLLARIIESLLLVGLGPVGPQGPQQQAAQDPFPGAQRGQCTNYGQQWVGAGVQQVVVPEGAQGHVLGPAGAERQSPSLFTDVDEDGVLVHGHLPDAGLGIVGGKLLPHHLPVLAAGQQGDAAGVARQLQGEGFGDGDGLEQVLHAQKGPLAGAGRRHRQKHRGTPVEAVSEKGFLDVEIHVCRLCLLELTWFSAGVRAATRSLPSPREWPRCGRGSGCPGPAAARLPGDRTKASVAAPAAGRRLRPRC